MVELPNRHPITGAEIDIVEMLEFQAAEQPLKVFLRTPTDSLTYGALCHNSARLAGALAHRGVGPQTSVAVLMENSVEQVVVWFALARLGALHAPLNTALVGSRLRHVLTVAQCSIAVIDADHLRRLEGLDEPVTALHTVVVHQRSVPGVLDLEQNQPAPRDPTRPSAGGSSGSRTTPARLRLADLISQGAPVHPAPSDPLAPATLLFTSGTTGVSKACTLSRRYLAVQGAAHAQNLGLGPDDVLYCPFPLFHIDAATLTVVAALSVGGTAALSPRFSASRFWDEVRTFETTVFNFMGATLTILWKQPPSARDRDHSVRLAWGVPMPDWHMEWTDRFGIPLYEVYGSTDAGVPVYDPLDRGHRPGACGRATDLYDVRIDGDTSPGEILVRGRLPGLTMSGYYAMPDATERTLDSEGWVRTGDLGAIDADGYLTFHGRATDSIRRRGENISALEVEELALSHPDVVEVAAIGVPSELTEEDVKVCIVSRSGTSLSPVELYEFLMDRAPRFMVPRYYEFVSALPKTPTQKVEKFKLKQAGITPATWDADRRPET